MSENPFASKTFTQVWNHHFNQGRKTVSFDGIAGILFVRTTSLPYYTNVGKNLTKGLTYTVKVDTFNGIGHNTLMVYDVPSYIENKAHEINGRLKIIKLDQYPGFFINLDNFSDVDDYLKKHFKKSSRYKLRKYKKRLETCFDISYRVFHGSIEKEVYDHLFIHFNALLEKRFVEKGSITTILTPKNGIFTERWPTP